MTIVVHRDFPGNTGFPAEDGAGVIGSGGCTRCGRDRKQNDPGVVSTDVQFYGEGEVVFCWPCAQEIGAATGMATPQKMAKLEKRIAELEALVASQAADLAAVSHVREALETLAAKADA